MNPVASIREAPPQHDPNELSSPHLGFVGAHCCDKPLLEPSDFADHCAGEASAEAAYGNPERSWWCAGMFPDGPISPSAGGAVRTRRICASWEGGRFGADAAAGALAAEKEEALAAPGNSSATGRGQAPAFLATLNRGVGPPTPAESGRPVSGLRPHAGLSSSA